MLSFCLNGLAERTVFKFISIKGIDLFRGTASVVLMVLQERKAGGWISGALGQTVEEQELALATTLLMRLKQSSYKSSKADYA